MDAPSAIEMMKRYNRNDILDNTGDISYSKLIAQNPNCHVYMYEIPHMTQSKNNKIDDCTYFELYKNNNTITNPYYKASGVQTYVQGTSSAAYGVAAFNLRSKFKKGLTDAAGNEVDGWSVADHAIPVELTCTKVNVASCENVNNVINQEWYNKFQPYHDAHRRKLREDGKTDRDTMEVNSGVLFIKDNNQEANYVFLDRPINVSIGKQAPNVYFSKALAQSQTGELVCGSIKDGDELKRNLQMNCIPEEILEMDYTRYNEFLEKRRTLMADKIKRYYYSL